jgi:hypothetical protein
MPLSSLTTTVQDGADFDLFSSGAAAGTNTYTVPLPAGTIEVSMRPITFRTPLQPNDITSYTITGAQSGLRYATVQAPYVGLADSAFRHEVYPALDTSLTVVVVSGVQGAFRLIGHVVSRGQRIDAPTGIARVILGSDPATAETYPVVGLTLQSGTRIDGTNPLPVRETIPAPVAALDGFAGVVAPAPGAVIVGPLTVAAAGDYLIEIGMTSNDVNAGNHYMSFDHLSAAAAVLHQEYLPPPGAVQYRIARLTLAVNDTLRVRVGAAVGAGTLYTGSIRAYKLT